MALGYSAFNTPHGILVPAISGSSFNTTFNNTATFTHGEGETCAAGEYRQYVKGELKIDGSVLDFYVCASSGTRLSKDVYREDGCPPNICTAYGYRACPDNVINRYSAPDRATGCAYQMSDTPGFSNIQAGKRYGMDVHFRGQLINVTNSNVLVTQDWSVVGEAVAPAASQSAPTLSSLEAGDRLMGVHVDRNSETEGLELHVVIDRPAGRAPLAHTALRVAAKDRNHRPVALDAPSVHEVGWRGRATVSFVYPLRGRGHVEIAEISLSEGDLVLPLAVIHR